MITEYFERAKATHDELCAQYKKAPVEDRSNLQPALLKAARLVEKAVSMTSAGITDVDLSLLANQAEEKPKPKPKKK